MNESMKSIDQERGMRAILRPSCREVEESDEIVLRYSKHIERKAHKFVKQRRASKDLKEELVQQGYIGLLEARERFDSSKNNNGFWSYACSFVIGRMKDYMIYNMNHIRPSRNLNSIILQIYKGNMAYCTPEYISNTLNCTLDMALQGLDYIRNCNVTSLYQPLSYSDAHENLELIDLIGSDEERDILFQVEVISGLSAIEQDIVKMLIDRYSARDIIRHCKISKYTLNNILKKIINNCGYDCTAILNKSEGWLMNLDQLDMDDEGKARTQLRWVPLEHVLPNPKNPRRDLTIKTKKLQDLIESVGWEEPLTCYASGNNFIILSGHRRWNAAVQLKKAMIPVYIVSAPKSEAEELDRIGSVQCGQVDWSQFDQVKYTYDRWIASGKKSFDDLGNELGITKGTVGSRIRVYKYYPKDEIEDKLNNRMYSIAMLDYIYAWIKRLAKHHPDLVESLGEHYIRRLMLKKYEARCFNSQIAHDHTFVTSATSQSIREFLIDRNRKLQDCQVKLSYIKDNEINSSAIISEIKGFQAKTKDEAEVLLLEIEYLLVCIEQMKVSLENNI
ncbi:sigma-70 family RNA polymerase sigma factor [Paenibacillus doosanensis]|uniref:sigma-70 family RNA polymerase sigma factor n=1 Tax=Paenibacillus doosanensis TaxID=1229154 RepID=UPI00217F679A|nr:sigma-70 family RNA polymerase sigma factor [Paenibacillus doosanensis]MCS7459198.1 sigma-70 family RNA polymerase sigma factor [Paenibacillus doosanensis]